VIVSERDVARISKARASGKRLKEIGEEFEITEGG
jgi:hypothetical protein